MVVLIVGAISRGVVFLLGSVGEIITEKSGHLNLGIPGIMCMGAAGGCYGVSIYMNALPSADSALWVFLMSSADSAVWFFLMLTAILFAALFGAFGGLIYSFLTLLCTIILF